MQQAKVEALAKMPQDAYDRIKTALLNKLNSFDSSFEGLLKKLLLIAANWNKLGMPAINGLVAYAVAGELLLESQQPTEQPPKQEAKEVQFQLEPQPRSVELKEEGKKLHVATFYQEKAKPKKEEWNYRNVVRAIGNHAKDHNEPMAIKYYGAALFLAHLMDTGRLTGTKVYFKIWKLSTREICNLIVEIHNQMIKNSYIDERGIIEWLSKKARKSPYDIAA